MSKYRYQVSVLLVCLCMLLSVSVVRGLLVSVPSTVYPDLVPTATQPYILEVPYGDVDYSVMLLSNGSCYAVNGSNGDRFVMDINETHVLEECIQGSASGDVIEVVNEDLFFDGSFVVDHALTVRVEGTSYQTGSISTASGVWIRELSVTNDGASIENVVLSGLNFEYLRFFADGQYIKGCFVDRCMIVHGATYDGLVFQGDGTVSGWMDSIYFGNCRFVFVNGVTNGDSFGLVTFVNTVQTTEIRLDNPEFELGGAASGVQSVFVVQDDADVDSLFVVNPRFYLGADYAAGNYIVYLQARSESCGLNLFWSGGRAEVHSDYTILKGAAFATETQLQFLMSGMSWQCDSGHTCTLMDVDGHNFIVSPGAGVDWSHNMFVGDGTFSVGANAVRCTRLDVIVKDNAGLSFGLVANPFLSVAEIRQLVYPSGVDAAPTANMFYKVQYSDIVVTSSGGTGVNITIVDPAGGVRLMDVSSCTREPVPCGWSLSFGDFSVAPTVEVWFDE